MSAHIIPIPSSRRPELLPDPVADHQPAHFHGTQCDFATWLAKLERTLRWLDRNAVPAIAFACSSRKGARVHVRSTPRLREMLRDETHSTGHRADAVSRWEMFQARDPSTGVLIVWEEDTRGAH
jgi:hypothetical protein